MNPPATLTIQAALLIIQLAALELHATLLAHDTATWRIARHLIRGAV